MIYLFLFFIMNMNITNNTTSIVIDSSVINITFIVFISIIAVGVFCVFGIWILCGLYYCCIDIYNNIYNIKQKIIIVKEEIKKKVPEISPVIELTTIV